MNTSSYAQANGASFDIYKHFYLFPIKPGIRNTLAGTMGELRRTHFHTGIDIRTAGVQGVPVLAAANGYISRIAVSPGGYGNALYMTHSNGQVTVYAHLKSFSSPIKEYVREEQYNKETFSLNLFPQRNQFSFMKGDTIALSGNSGSSGGPHLHFEIRDDEQRALNPLEYGFEEIVDGRPPEVRSVFFQSIGPSSRIDGEFGKAEYAVVKKGNDFIVEDTVRVFGKVAVELFAFDRQDWTRFRTGINEISMSVDGVEHFHQRITKLSFARSRDYYNYINYAELHNHGKRVHKLYVDDGNLLDFFTTNGQNGFLSFEEECESQIEIKLYDSYRNESRVIINVICERPEGNREGIVAGTPYEIVNSTLVFRAEHENLDPEEVAQFHSGENVTELSPSYTSGSQNVYLWDLTTQLPDSVVLCDQVTRFDIDALVPPAVTYQFYSDFLEAKFGRSALFDTAFVFAQYERKLDVGEVFTLGPSSYPLRRNIDITLRPVQTYEDRERTHVYGVNQNNDVAYIGGSWDEGNSISFKTRAFGSYTIQTDSIPPYLRPLIVNKDRLVFRIHDRMSGIRSFKVWVDEAWVLMHYDPKLRQIWSEKRTDDQEFSGELTVLITDNAGNETDYQTTITK